MAVRLRLFAPSRVANEVIWRLWRHFSSETISRLSTESFNKAHKIDKDGGGGGGCLKTRILKLVYPRRSATAVLQNWVEEGRGRVSVSELRCISRLLLKRQRFKHALEIFTWMEAKERSRMSAADHAMRLELTIKVHTVGEAEEYFEILPDTVSKKAACLPLLHSYVKERSTEKAEAFMQKMNSLGLIVNPHPFNEMMKLYIATSQHKKVLAVIVQMKQNRIPRNVLSYNLWMNACAELSGVGSAEDVYKEMIHDKNVVIGWSSLSTLANIYQKSGAVNKAFWALREAENKLSSRNRLGYLFLSTIYTSLNRKDEVVRLWKASKGVKGRITCANYMCILSCLVKLGDIKEAENIFLEWESQCRTFDIRVPNILLGAYMRNGMMKKAESLFIRSLNRGGCPNYKTWEIFTEGWVRSNEMDKAIDTMRRCLSTLEDCDWRPSASIVVAIAEYFEKKGKIEDAKQYLGVIRSLGLASLPVYKSLLRMHAYSQRPTEYILELMHKDGIELDYEASALVHEFNI
ncbi:pentatricopeptide repeat-containing protein At5g27460 [Coffea eugenioides]|uniref:pentatricopeptide repeat-containing protein At5g27460 n=1 Tax=Coffea eugenioides TaxID=49369 RepID=UPI000F6105C1|nr:pentatricopeptide repeat-containing protein At5g27460 [Coffea eugenioides]